MAVAGADANLIPGDPVPGQADLFKSPMSESLALRRGFRGRMSRNPDWGAKDGMMGSMAYQGAECLVY